MNSILYKVEWDRMKKMEATELGSRSLSNGQDRDGKEREAWRFSYFAFTLSV